MKTTHPNDILLSLLSFVSVEPIHGWTTSTISSTPAGLRWTTKTTSSEASSSCSWPSKTTQQFSNQPHCRRNMAMLHLGRRRGGVVDDYYNSTLPLTTMSTSTPKPKRKPITTSTTTTTASMTPTTFGAMRATPQQQQPTSPLSSPSPPPNPPLWILEYSPNFHRHIVRMAHSATTTMTIGTVVIESFPWFDEAMENYPHVHPQPLIWPQAQIAGVTAADSGGGCTQDIFYPSHRIIVQKMEKEGQGPDETTTTNDLALLLQRKQRMSEYLQRKLLWFPSQLDRLIQMYPKILDWPLSLLQERIDFFLAPSPPNQSNVFQTFSASSSGPPPVDWPRLFYNDGYGAGMSVAQVTHGLLTVPQVLLRIKLHSPIRRSTSRGNLNAQLIQTRTTTRTTTAQPTEKKEDAEDERRERDTKLEAHRQIAFLYQETPPIVMEVTRKQLSYFLQGASTLDFAAYSYLHWKGWEFDQIFSVLQALPATLEVSSEVSWEVYANPGARRSPLLREWIDYWQMTFQMRPMHIQAMLKTHSRLSSYSVMQLQRNVFWLLQELHLSLSQIRSLLLRSPDILGVSVSSLIHRSNFWMTMIGLDVKQFSQVVTKHPSLVRYSVADNLQPKLDFFTTELHIELSMLQKMTVLHPQIWGRSLEGHIRPMVQGLVQVITVMEDGTEENSTDVKRRSEFWRGKVGQLMIAKAPELLKFHWTRNLKLKTEFLLQHCGYDVTTRLLLQTPRVLCQSLTYSLQPKLALIQQYHDDDGPKNSNTLLLQSPSLLLMTKRNLEARLERMKLVAAETKGRHDDGSELHSLQPFVVVKGPKPTTQIAAISTLLSAADNNDDGVNSEQSPQGTCTIGDMLPTLKGTVPVNHLNNAVSMSTVAKRMASKSQALDLVTRLLRLDEKSCVAAPTLVASSSSLKVTTNKGNHQHYVVPLVLTIFVTARAYPSEALIRGRQRSGGMAFHVPQFSRDTWRTIMVTARLWQGQNVQLLPNGKTMIMGYKYVRPSRCRCSLYAIRDALRTARTWIDDYERRQQQQQPTKELHRPSNGCDNDDDDDDMLSVGVSLNRSSLYVIDIVTDSNYCLDLLCNETQILEWGHAESRESLRLWRHHKTSGRATSGRQHLPPQQLPLANADILYPLSKFFVRLVQDYDQRVQINFRKEFLKDLGDAAQLAAQLSYATVK